jgi:hypothetical protein
MSDYLSSIREFPNNYLKNWNWQFKIVRLWNKRLHSFDDWSRYDHLTTTIPVEAIMVSLIWKKN